MADSLYDIIAPHLSSSGFGIPIPRPDDPVTIEYLQAITRLSHTSLTTTEPQRLVSEAQAISLSLQTIATRSYRGILTSSDHLSHISASVPQIRASARALSEDEIPKLDSAATAFAKRYARPAQNPALAKRREALTLATSVDRISDILEIPTLLSSAIAAGGGGGGGYQTQPGSSTAGTQSRLSSASANSSYTAALDLFSHVKRLQTLYPHSRLIHLVGQQAGEEMKRMTTNLLTSLQSKNLKLAGAMRTIGWLRRIAPELDSSWGWYPSQPGSSSSSSSTGNNNSNNSNSNTASSGAPKSTSEGSLGAVLLVCRLTNLLATLDGLEPLRVLAEQEARNYAASGSSSSRSWTDGQHTERYLKRYIEVFREQSFSIVSTFKGVFAGSKPDGSNPSSSSPPSSSSSDPAPAIPSALATFPLHLSNLLIHTLRLYLPVLRDGATRESVCSQVLFCADSLGRLGADFGLLLASLLDELGEDENVNGGGTEGERRDMPEWIDLFKKHKVQVSRLETLASGASAAR